LAQPDNVWINGAVEVPDDPSSAEEGKKRTGRLKTLDGVQAEDHDLIPLRSWEQCEIHRAVTVEVGRHQFGERGRGRRRKGYGHGWSECSSPIARKKMKERADFIDHYHVGLAVSVHVLDDERHNKVRRG